MAQGYRIQQVTAPATGPVTLAEMKEWLRVDHSLEDGRIQGAMDAAVLWCEDQAERAFVKRRVRAVLDEFPADGGAIELPIPRAIEVYFVKYNDEAGAEQTLAPLTYILDDVSEPGLLCLAPSQVWPTVQVGRVNAVRVEYEAGYGDAAQVDPRAKQAVQLLAAHWYENREAVITGTIQAELDLSLRALLTQLWPGKLR
jgi:uncharacterized phiE125 gp8 family phage protein